MAVQQSFARFEALACLMERVRAARHHANIKNMALLHRYLESIALLQKSGVVIEGEAVRVA
jgi:hypothetical protein